MTRHACRFCASPLDETFVDLGPSPLANAYLEADQDEAVEAFYPLCTLVCTRCHLVQLPAVEQPEAIFRDYAYFSSYADTWLRHAEAYAETMIPRFALDADSLVLEVASNDGYLLRFFRDRLVPVLGIEPAHNVAAAAERLGIPTVTEFFGSELAAQLVAEGKQADLVAANNVLAHTPFLNDFVSGLAAVVKPGGVVTLEFPHLAQLIRHNQFDTIYHEHFSYFSFATVCQVLEAHALMAFDVEQLPTHGGSLRVFAQRRDAAPHAVEERVGALLAAEEADGLLTLAPYRAFAERVRATKRGLLRFLIGVKEAGETIVGYGAPAKGNTLLNYCGVRTDFLDFTVDRSPHKQGCLLPGTHIPIRHPDAVREARPHYLLILPWNLKDEIMEQMAEVRDWGGRFVVAIPEVEVTA